MAEFIQTGPVLSNQYEDDRLLKLYLKAYLPEEAFQFVNEDLSRFGQRVVDNVLKMGEQAERIQPHLKPFDPWGTRIDEIVVDSSWKALDQVSAEEGLIAIAYERQFSEFSRPYQFAKMYLFHPSSAYYSCPLAMTDGAAKLIEVHGTEELKKHAYKHLTSRKPTEFWTSGQWMTERAGGSDVGLSETRAVKSGSRWKLYGTKWFTSATTSQMAMTLARIEDSSGQVTSGSRGLSLFYLELRDKNNKLNNIEVLRLKDKLGTKALPTAELRLAGTEAILVGSPGEGVKNIATLFNVTRIDNTCAAVSTSRRILALAKDYAQKRFAFGKHLKDHPLHIKTLSDCSLEFYGSFTLAFYVSRLLGIEECDPERRAEVAPVLRLLTPIAKLYTAKQNLKIVSELTESFGGAGYVEDTGIPKFLRDSQVLSIWEGTTNILSLDVLRALSKEQVFEPYYEHMRKILDEVKDSALSSLEEQSHRALDQMTSYTQKLQGHPPEVLEVQARNYAYALARTTCSILLLDLASRTKSPEVKSICESWNEKNLTPLLDLDQDHLQRANSLLSMV